MRTAIRQIDRALKRLYHLAPAYRAEDFLISRPVQTGSIGSSTMQGALFVRTFGAAESTRDLSLGIYLSDRVRRELSSFRGWRAARWSKEQMSAFTVATEEVSHFHYLLHHATQRRPVSQLELEMQGEIDKFLLTFFAHRSRPAENEKLFDRLFELIFFRFRLAEHLSSEEQVRYRDANNLARHFVQKYARPIANPERREQAFRVLRRFYRLSACEKISLVSS